ncbi:MAG TPA: colanic acid biosynthesis glycosyltransferase WcaL [Deltaproteobacteria bacterium]|nr:colanic acid biosynthesis glycosyltransferase WcaL [Candidatus Binatota bacterium]HIL13840.1 colanic acid biosynthesis glycosyltransferase WcaL [Deltaproteobacteria bacterium]
MRRLAYLFPAFPVLHQTFTVGEVLGLKRRGYDLRLVSLKPRSKGQQQPEALPLIEETAYCPRILAPAMLAATLRALTSRPFKALGLVGYVFTAWRDVPERVAGDRGGVSTMGLQERADAFLKSNDLLYLLRSFAMLPYAFYLAELFEREGIEHVHAHWATYPTTVAMLVRRWSGIPYSFTAHAYDIHVVARLLPEKIRSAEFVVTCARVNANYLASTVDRDESDKIHVNYHGADLERFSLARKEEHEVFRVMTCGSLEEYKGIHYLFDAIAVLAQRGISVSCDVAGDGPQRAFLEKKATELGISARVTFHGYIDHNRLSGLYRAADIFALPSIVLGRYGKQDVIPNVLAEAMATGLPVIGSNISGVPELIDDGVDGILVEQRDSEGLADAIARLHGDADLALRIGSAARMKVEDIWDREKNLVELGAIINSYLRSGEAGGL